MMVSAKQVAQARIALYESSRVQSGSPIYNSSSSLMTTDLFECSRDISASIKSTMPSLTERDTPDLINDSATSGDSLTSKASHLSPTISATTIKAPSPTNECVVTKTDIQNVRANNVDLSAPSVAPTSRSSLRLSPKPVSLQNTSFKSTPLDEDLVNETNSYKVLTSDTVNPLDALLQTLGGNASEVTFWDDSAGPEQSE
ncbi:hypothetical protein QCA50_015105 [Cerrena zonata]|uniref:Uncharacterized protein n=1 Tax=Cerrena zonata TaxID=2478898 RepID=A0AAW0FJ76_9APHY